MKEIDKVSPEKEILQIINRGNDLIHMHRIPIRYMEYYLNNKRAETGARAVSVWKDNNEKLFVSTGGYSDFVDKSFKFSRLNKRSKMAVAAYVKAVHTYLLGYEQWLLLHKTHFPNEPVKSWINNKTYTNIYKNDIGSLYDLISHLPEEKEEIKVEIDDRCMRLKMIAWNNKVGKITLVTPEVSRDRFYDAVLNLVIQYKYIKNGTIL